ncbi:MULTISPECIES: VOC family protein [Sphingobacterium]|uniref:Predicted enzyme related to lactoylglutathione lyase n=1 Tax=Sphingobacterium multivorum TaxID=28454 RepID=A0A2X2J236_SPHMU|nr:MULTISPECIES: VOC family protein [Sphingobacterium]QRQ63676.1 VOC family protein [Sphingobacterium multivorum]SPZ85746.1 Predicted enzyme related to lactoylglutathione lyase [Sphingobacterium multivorum]
MQKLKKIDKQTNIITWFEIPVTDIDRAKKFYETILDIEMVQRADGNDQAVFFPFNPSIIQATSGRVTGVLSKSERNSPSGNGTVVYINASPDIQKVLDKVEKAGGKIIAPKTQIPAGYIAIIIDSEGNKIGLHAEE